MALPRDPFSREDLGEDREILDIIPERFDSDPDSRQARRAAYTRLTLTVSLVVLAVMALGIAAKHILFGEAPRDHQMSAPVIHADDKPIKVRPQDRGGMDVPNQDKLIYDRMAAKNGDQQPERLLPPPEAAQAPPTPDRTQPASAPAPASTPSLTAPAVSAPLPPSAANSTGAPSAANSTGAPLAANSTGAPLAANAPASPRMASSSAASAPMLAPVKPQTPPAPPPPAAKTSAPAPAPVAKSGGGWLVQLGAVHSEAEAKTEWNRLKGVHHQLAELSADIVRVDIPGKGVFWRVRGGPLDEAQARLLCSDLTKQGQACILARK